MTTATTTRTVAEIDAEIRKLQQERHAALPKVTKEEKKKQLAEIRAAKYKTTNGLTIHGLRNAGIQTRVIHIRNAYVPGCPVAVPVPTNLRGAYEFLGKGGTTHILVEDKEGTIMVLTAICHEVDNFDYKLGVKNALDRLTPDEANQLITTGVLPIEVLA